MADILIQRGTVNRRGFAVEDDTQSPVAGPLRCTILGSYANPGLEIFAGEE
jgi:hypothetical protein